MAFSKPRRSARKAQSGRNSGDFRQPKHFSAPDKKASAPARKAENTKEQSDSASEFLFQHAVALAVSNAQLEDKLDSDHPHRSEEHTSEL